MMHTLDIIVLFSLTLMVISCVYATVKQNSGNTGLAYMLSMFQPATPIPNNRSGSRKSIMYWTGVPGYFCLTSLGEKLPCYHNEEGEICVQDPSTNEEVIMLWG